MGVESRIPVVEATLTRHEHEVDFLTLDFEVVHFVHGRAVNVLLALEDTPFLLENYRDTSQIGSLSREHVPQLNRAVGVIAEGGVAIATPARTEVLGASLEDESPAHLYPVVEPHFVENFSNDGSKPVVLNNHPIPPSSLRNADALECNGCGVKPDHSH